MTAFPEMKNTPACTEVLSRAFQVENSAAEAESRRRAMKSNAATTYCYLLFAFSMPWGRETKKLANMETYNFGL